MHTHNVYWEEGRITGVIHKSTAIDTIATWHVFSNRKK